MMVRDLFGRYLETGSVVKLQSIFDAENVRLPIRTDGTGKQTGGGLISRGHLYKILSNPIYVGSLSHKGQVHRGLHAAIVDQPTWDRVQSQLAANIRRASISRQNSEALLAGKLFDDRGNMMSPSHAAKGGRRWRYYVSRALLQGRKQDAGSLARAPAAEIERLVIEAVRAAQSQSARSIANAGRRCTLTSGAINARELEPTKKASLVSAAPLPDEGLREVIECVTISQTMVEIQMAGSSGAEGSDRILTVPWVAPSAYRRREIIQGQGERELRVRPMRVKARAVFVEALRCAHRWLDELMADPRQSVEKLAAREGKTERSIRMTLSLAFLAPGIVTAAIEGRLPRGFGVARLVDPPITWSDQWPALGLIAHRQTESDPNIFGGLRIESPHPRSNTGGQQSAADGCLPVSNLNRTAHLPIRETEFGGQRLSPISSSAGPPNRSNITEDRARAR